MTFESLVRKCMNLNKNGVSMKIETPFLVLISDSFNYSSMMLFFFVGVPSGVSLA